MMQPDYMNALASGLGLLFKQVLPALFLCLSLDRHNWNYDNPEYPHGTRVCHRCLAREELVPVGDVIPFPPLGPGQPSGVIEARWVRIDEPVDWECV